MTYFGWEMELLRVIQELHTQLLTPVLVFLSWINNHGEFWILTGLILTIIPKTRKCGISVLLAMLFGTLITDLTLKGICARPRPYYYTEYMDGNHIRLLIEMKERELLRSFPSGHSVCSFAAAVSILFYYRKAGIAALILAFLIAFSRLYLFVHFPTDVLAGICIGTLCAVFSCMLTGRLYAGRKGTKQ